MSTTGVAAAGSSTFMLGAMSNGLRLRLTFKTVATRAAIALFPWCSSQSML
ncbi:MAG: hypothetical protein HWQ41_03040 [Nostoc sp. NOS(2021)]|uniref:hypothetical protein n=1 Tax=Nostoc sp. NOS(2021) TaxID=2815407 RepID=UPI0025DDB29B|nr:hypothetical protein [Nostoc sp. NOS(2021)]MBN3894268.1 hypothetical protein [Nostoc sp. NOS(2021)]